MAEYRDFQGPEKVSSDLKLLIQDATKKNQSVLRQEIEDKLAKDLENLMERREKITRNDIKREVSCEMELLVRKTERRLRSDLRLEVEDMVIDQAPNLSDSSASLKLFRNKVDNIVEEQKDKLEKRIRDLEKTIGELEQEHKDGNATLNDKMEKLIRQKADKVIMEEVNKAVAETREALKDDIKVLASEESRVRSEKLRSDIDSHLDELSSEYDQKIQEQIVEYMQKIQDELDDTPEAPEAPEDPRPVSGKSELREELKETSHELQEKLKKQLENYVDDIFSKLKEECVEECGRDLKEKMEEDLDARDRELLRKVIQMEFKGQDDQEKVPEIDEDALQEIEQKLQHRMDEFEKNMKNEAENRYKEGPLMTEQIEEQVEEKVIELLDEKGYRGYDRTKRLLALEKLEDDIALLRHAQTESENEKSGEEEEKAKKARKKKIGKVWKGNEKEIGVIEDSPVSVSPNHGDWLDLVEVDAQIEDFRRLVLKFMCKRMNVARKELMAYLDTLVDTGATVLGQTSEQFQSDLDNVKKVITKKDKKIRKVDL
ncbi:uncharacterized abhydrolase domain-containing protein DDB_G0269086-like [Lineus longissimus]|uniref:uncharacterized abhydrolase domain-containing protein DDB_G0269086-like n=1 Tax=Lineus longissimus TaxID=88925 RepID=UPI00315CD9E1